MLCLDLGADFLGFNIRRYLGKLLIKPSTAAVKPIQQRAVHDEAAAGAKAEAVPHKLNPIIRDWLAYNRHPVSSRTLNELDRATGEAGLPVCP